MPAGQLLLTTKQIMKSSTLENCCANCRHELTCARSGTDETGVRSEISYQPCPLGLSPLGNTYFAPKPNDVSADAPARAN